MRYNTYKVSVNSVIFISTLMVIAGVFAKDSRFITYLRIVPVIAVDQNDVSVTDLKKEEFTIFEDDVEQKLADITTNKEPTTNVVLMLDTSACAPEKIAQLQSAAISFVKQLKPTDRVKIISFDEKVRELSEFTNDQVEMRRAINSARSGEGTKLYEAIQLALKSLEKIEAIQAIVLFTDGIDWRSEATSYEDNIRKVEESGAIIFPIRYDTRPETEEMIRNQKESLAEVDLGIIFGGPNNRVPKGKTPLTLARGNAPPPSTVKIGKEPDPGQTPPISSLPPGSRYPDQYPGGGRYPDDRRYPDNRLPGGNRTPTANTPVGGGNFPQQSQPHFDPRGRETMSEMIDNLYRTGDKYLGDLADKSGGKVYRVDKLDALPGAMTKIAEQLRNPYTLAYYLTNDKQDGTFRKIQVKTTRKDVILRFRPGYRMVSAK
ncbi:MAG: VWA domain-containing protein [Acidobacteria bacterium]|nr:VWA domain-containing protein [Acidobacteriota bacterium]